MQNISLKQIWSGVIAFILVIIFPLLVTNTFAQHVMILFFMFGMMGVAWNIMGGYAGMFSFGQVAFFGIGAYTSSFLLIAYHVNPDRAGHRWFGRSLGGCSHWLPLLEFKRALLCDRQHCLWRDRPNPFQ